MSSGRRVIEIVEKNILSPTHDRNYEVSD